MTDKHDRGSQSRDFGSEAPELSHLLYTDSNEDAEMAVEALDVQAGDIVSGITGNADLLLLALKDDPASVTGYDIVPAQTSFAELKKKAIEMLDYDDYCTLLGYRGTPDERGGLLKRVAAALPKDHKEFWEQDNMVELARKGLWDKGGATAKDYSQWRKAISDIKDFLPADEFDIALGFKGTKEERAAIFKKIRRHDNKYEDPVIINNNHYKFNILRYPDGIVNSDYAVKYCTGFVPDDMIRPAISEADFNAIRPRLDRISFRTDDIISALDSMPDAHFDRLYMSNVVDYLTTARQKEIVNKVLEKGKPGSLMLYLYIALVPIQRQDLLDHKQWSERGFLRLINAEALKKDFVASSRETAEYLAKKLAEVDGETFEKAYSNLEGLVDDIQKGDIEKKIKDLKKKAKDADYAALGEDIAEDIAGAVKNVGKKIRDFDYKGFGNRWKNRFIKGKKTVEGRVAETKQLTGKGYILVENDDRTMALYSDLQKNVHATMRSRSFYGFDHVIMEKVEKDGAVYNIPDRAG